MDLDRCPVALTVDVMGGKWKPTILYHLKDGPRRFNELRRLMPDITQRMLTLQLRALEDDGIVTRKVHAQVPPRVEYALSDHGRTLGPILDAMVAWGEAHGGAMPARRDRRRAGTETAPIQPREAR
jgi:DNA-binding HxlR family transcriptional regulator